MGRHEIRYKGQVISRFERKGTDSGRETGQYELADLVTRYLYAGWLAGMGLVFAYAFLFVPSR